MNHVLKTDKAIVDRISTEERRVLIVDRGPDYQVGDLLEVTPVTKYGNRSQHFVERDAKGRFVNEYVDDQAVTVMVTHVLNEASGLLTAYVALSIELTA